MAHLSFLILTLKHRNNEVDINIPSYLLPDWKAWLNADFSNPALLNLQPSQWHIPITSLNPSGFRNEQKATLLFQHACGAAPDHIPPIISWAWFSWLPRSPLSSGSGYSKALQGPAWDIREGIPSQGDTQPPSLMQNTWPSTPSASPSHSYCALPAQGHVINWKLKIRWYLLYLTTLDMKVNKPWPLVVLLISAVASVKQNSSSEITWVTSTAHFTVSWVTKELGKVYWWI